MTQFENLVHMFTYMCVLAALCMSYSLGRTAVKAYKV